MYDEGKSSLINSELYTQLRASLSIDKKKQFVKSSLVAAPQTNAASSMQKIRKLVGDLVSKTYSAVGVKVRQLFKKQGGQGTAQSAATPAKPTNPAL